ncbi:MAG TPA: hypothetical protein VEA36_00080, partial [Candidatus Paceibacterota bacterium]|nr:hypothetical protein [Candidatus Paceibacterota bacterium]
NPTMNGPIAAARQEILNYDNALAAAERFRAKEAELDAERRAIPPESLVRLESFLPDGVDNVQLILDLDALASRTGLTLAGFDVTEMQTTEEVDPNGIIISDDLPTESIELTTTGTGSYESFRRFLTGAERSLRPLDIASLRITTSEAGVYTYNITFRLYWLK